MKAENGTSLEQMLEQRILHGLACEWKNAVLFLNHAIRNKMRLPLFSIREMHSRLGTWNVDKEEICLSRHLVMDHSWDAVLEVLFHEMAHQLADQVLNPRHEPPHGPCFQKACYLLRANPKASGNFKTLDDIVGNSLEPSSNAQLRRIKKLMALATSQNLNEARAAMVKAHQLIKKYNIDLIELNEDRDFLSIFLGKPALRHGRDDYRLALLLQHFYFVECIWVSAFVLGKNKMGRVLEITGTLPNIQTASYVYDYVKRFIASRWETYSKGKKLDAGKKVDFSQGILKGFRSRLEEPNKPRIRENKIPAGEIIRMEDPLLKAHMAYKYPHTRRISRQGRFQDMDVVNDGMAAGKELVIAKGISKTEKSALLLP
ncbi:MAG: DUF2786 domain-containing protein [Desulfobacteraceae bacterium]|nr:DUF2786 domain-containing protein [Desulfobacteraceae bacterium]